MAEAPLRNSTSKLHHIRISTYEFGRAQAFRLEDCNTIYIHRMSERASGSLAGLTDGISLPRSVSKD